MVFSPAGRGNFLYLKISDPPWVSYDIMTPGAGWNQVSGKDEVSFWITLGRNPKISGRTYAYDYPDANTGNNIAGRTMNYLIRCPR